MVVRRHLAAVDSGDPEAMAADYATDAVLVRDVRYVGRDAIRDYFLTVPERLGGEVVRFGPPEPRGETVVVPWRIGEKASGRDTYVVEHGVIVSQVVALDGDDF